MNWKITFDVKNCDSDHDHPQAQDQVFQLSCHCVAATEDEALEAALAKLQAQHPKCTFHCTGCEEWVLPTGRKTNVVMKEDQKNVDTSEKARHPNRQLKDKPNDREL